MNSRRKGTALFTRIARFVLAKGDMTRRKGIMCILAFSLAWLGGPGASAQEPLPLFDAHVHYSRLVWGTYAPKQVLDILAAAGVRRALVSSTPDDGTLKLYQADPRRIVPILRPYRDELEMLEWTRSEAAFEYVSALIRRGIYKGIGEFRLTNKDVNTPQIRKLARLAAERDVVLHIHSGAGPVPALFAHAPKVKILWAHAGMNEPPKIIQGMMDKYANLWADLSQREDHIAPGGKLDPNWRALLFRHPDRFLFGTDPTESYAVGRWKRYRELVEAHRAYLRLLPREVAERIGYRNAVGLFGAGGSAGLPD